MRHILFALLVAAPTALITWILTKGTTGECPEPSLSTAASAPVAAAPAALPEPTAPMAPATPPASDGTHHVLRELCTGTLNGVKLLGEVTMYDQRSLFEYINGAAPVFLANQFRELAAGELKTSAGGELTCDVYDMTTPASAAAIYAKERPPSAKRADFGDEGHRASQALVFHKGSYYVKLTAFDAAAEAALPQVARGLVEKMR